MVKQEIEEWIVTADYMTEKEMVVTVKKGDDPLDPGKWIDVLDERDIDCSLWDTKKAEPNT